MNRSGYNEDGDWDEDTQRRVNLYQGAIKRALTGKRGQALLRRIVAALDAMPVKELERDTFGGKNSGCMCAFGALAVHEGIDVADLEPLDDEGDPVEADILAARFGCAEALAREIMWTNDTAPIHGLSVMGPRLPPNLERQRRWKWTRGWCAARIVE